MGDELNYVFGTNWSCLHDLPYVIMPFANTQSAMAVLKRRLSLDTYFAIYM